MIKFTRYLLLFLLTLGQLFLFAQSEEANTQQTSLNDSLEVDQNDDFLFIGISYVSNSTKNQNFKDTKIPTIIGDVTFYHHYGIYASAVYSNYISATTNTYEAELQIGYQKSFWDLLNLDFYYGYRYFNGDDTYESIDYSQILSFNSNLEISFLTFNINNYMFLGSSSNYYLDFDAGISYDFEDLIFKNDILNVNPSFSVSYGTDYWIYDNMSARHMNTVHKFLDDLNHPINTFEYQSLNFFFPIIYNINNYSISFSWLYSIPSQKFKLLNWDDQSAFMISIIYSPNI